MNRLDRRRTVATAIVVAVGCLVLLAAGCGGSSSSSKSAGMSSTAATPSTTTTTTGGSTTSTSAAKSGTTGNAPSTHTPPSSTVPRSSSPVLHKALTMFVTCLSENGVKIAPDTSGKGALLSLKGVDTASPQFRAADKKCVAALRATLKSTAGKQPPTSKTAAPTVPTSPHLQAKPKVNVSPKIAHALEHFTACMREHGITNFPEPEGESFNTTHIHLDSSSPQYKAAAKACNPILKAAL
jgi:hypothetical protein